MEIAEEIQMRGREAPSGEQGPTSIQQLKTADRGRDAWTVLIAGIAFEALFWGFPSSFGVFQAYYSSLPQFQPSSSNIPLIGTLAQGLFYLLTPLSALLTKKFPRYQRAQIYLGWPLCIASLVAASFSTSVNTLIATQGVLYGLGFVTLTLPIVSMLNEWWVSRKGMAFGLISASSGVTGAFLPPVTDVLLRRYGYATTLRAYAVALAILTGPLIPLFRGRLPASSGHNAAAVARIDLGLVRRPLFWVYGTAVLVQGVGFFFPPVFLPSYAASVGLGSTMGAALLTAMSVAQVAGQFAFGYLSDKKLSVGTLSVVCCVAAATASSTFWGLGRSVGLLVAFSLVYGFFGFGFGTMRVAMGRAIDSDPSAVFTLYSIFVFLQGVGNVLVGPLSAALLSEPAVGDGFGAGRFAGLIWLTTATSVAAAVIIGAWHGVRRVIVL